MQNVTGVSIREPYSLDARSANRKRVIYWTRWCHCSGCLQVHAGCTIVLIWNLHLLCFVLNWTLVQINSQSTYKQMFLAEHSIHMFLIRNVNMGWIQIIWDTLIVQWPNFSLTPFFIVCHLHHGLMMPSWL